MVLMTTGTVGVISLLVDALGWRGFEDSLSTYTGDDPLDPWDRFVEYLEKGLPAEDSKGMLLVLDRLVARFLHEERYSNDIRYVNYCIKCASYYADPIKFYSCIHSRGIGTRTAALYAAWAQQFEQRGLNEQAEAVYQRAMENQAQPADTVLQDYRLFQMRTSTIQAEGIPGARNPLQNSQLANQMSSHREPVMQNKLQGSTDCLSQLPANGTVCTISRSEIARANPPGQAASLQTESMYREKDLVCEGSEFCFEEVRANRYFLKLKQEKELREFEASKKRVQEQEEEIRRMKRQLEEFDCNLGASASLPSAMYPGSGAAATSLNPIFVQQSLRRSQPLNRLSNRPSSGLRLYSEQGFRQETMVPAAYEQHNHPRASVPDTLNSESCRFLSGQADMTIPSPESAQPQVNHDQPPSIQASLAQPKPQQQSTHSEQSTLDHQTPLDSEGFHQGSNVQFNASVNHLTNGFLQHSGRDQDAPVSETSESEDKLDVSRGGTANLSHITPNTSLGLAHATPSRVHPSPTVNTREALDAIMGMFQAPSLLDDPFSRMSMIQAEKSFELGHQRAEGATSFSKPAAAAPFTIFEDDKDKENSSATAAANSASAVAEKAKPARALAEILFSKTEKPNETSPELMPDESTMWGAHRRSLAACPNSTRDFAMSAHLMSTPFTHKGPFFMDFNRDQESEGPAAFGDTEENLFVLQPKKLSPIMEQSPLESDKLSDTAVGPMRAQGPAEQGTIVGEGLAIAQRSLAASSITEVHPPAVLSFRDQTLIHTETAVPKSPPKATGPGWDVYMSPEQSPKPASLPSQQPELSVKPKCQAFALRKAFHKPTSPTQAPKCTFDVPMSPECAPRVKTPDAFMSVQQIRRVEAFPQNNLDVPMSPEPTFCSDVPMSPMQRPQFNMTMDVMSPERGLKMSTDVPMSPGPAAVELVSNPWDDDLIASLLSQLATPLTSHPNFFTWKYAVPNIAPKMTIRMGKGSLKVDRVIGEGAFATVYQATDLRTSEKMFIKVQKPASPWEFYINTQLNARLQPSIRHLFNIIHSAHIFQNGSLLLGDLHNCGTLLNAVNLYKNLSDKVMPQPLVMYFTICILHMVEELHKINIVHADIKPDNFILGERFLENTSFDPENLNHGLALIDLGQSIDMEIFPKGTAFTAKCMTSGFQCTEMLSGRPWNYQTDYFGIAGTVYCMLFGTYMQVENADGVWKTNAVFRRNPHSDLWLDLFHTLLNVPDCSSLPCLRSLRNKLKSVLQENYSNKLSTLKNRLVVQLLESRSARR